MDESRVKGFDLSEQSDGSGTDYRKILIVMGVFLIVAAAVSVPTAVILSKGIKTIVLPEGEPDRIECPLPNGEPIQAECESRGCQWSPVSFGPHCFLPKSSNYIISKRLSTNDGFYFELQYSSNVTLISKPYMIVFFQVIYDSENQVTFKIHTGSYAPNVVPKPNIKNLKYDVIVEGSEGSEFHFQIIRKDENITIWDSSLAGLVLEHRYLQIATRLPSKRIYGLGENSHRNFKRDLDYVTWPIFSRNHLSSEHRALNGGGFHPFYLCLEGNNGKAHAVYFNNHNAVEYILLPAPGIVFRSIGGVLDFTIFIGDSPKETMRLALEVLGKPGIIPYWSLGLGITPDSNTKEIVEEFISDGMPLDYVQLDPHNWNENKIFDVDSLLNITSDSGNKYKLIDFVKEQREKNNLHFVIALDPAFNNSDYFAYEEGLKGNHFIQWPDEIPQSNRTNPPDTNSSNVMYGSRAGKPVAFPDITKKGTIDWWKMLLKNLKNSLPYDGIHLINNEPFSQNFCPQNDENCWHLKCPYNALDNPPYKPAAAWVHGKDSQLSDGTLCMVAAFGENRKTTHFEIHNTYGMDLALASQSAFESEEKKYLVVSQSINTNKRTLNPIGHWISSKIEPTWEGMRSTVKSILEFNLFGFPYVGAPICGDDYKNLGELCSRWVQLAAFYPQVRLGIKSQQKERLSQDFSKVLQEAFQFRYSLIPYFYSVYCTAHLHGEMVVRPLFYEFPNDPNATDIYDQFMWGPAIMFAPIMEPITNENKFSFQIYYPKDVWYKLRTETSSRIHFEGVGDGGYKHSVYGTDEMPIFIRGGYVLPFHSPGNNVFKMRQSPLILKVFPKNHQSSGYLYWDNGIEQDKRLHFSFNQNQCELNIKRDKAAVGFKGTLTINEIIIYDSNAATSANVTMNNIVTDCKVDGIINLKILNIFISLDLLDPDVDLWIIRWNYNNQCITKIDPR